jgi:hypothetical protein
MFSLAKAPCSAQEKRTEISVAALVWKSNILAMGALFVALLNGVIFISQLL